MQTVFPDSVAAFPKADVYGISSPVGFQEHSCDLRPLLMERFDENSGLCAFILLQTQREAEACGRLPRRHRCDQRLCDQKDSNLIRELLSGTTTTEQQTEQRERERGVMSRRLSRGSIIRQIVDAAAPRGLAARLCVQ